MNGNFMKICYQPKPETGRRWVSILMMISLLVGSVSIASFAKGTDKPERGWRIGIDVSRQQPKKRTGRTGTATPSELSLPATASNATASNMEAVNYTLGELLEQSDTSGAVTAEWFQVKLDDTIIANSNDYRVKLKSGTRIRPDATVEHRLKVTLLPGELEGGDTVTWNLGRIEGLNLPEVVGEEMTLDGTDFGWAELSYENGTLYLKMEFYEWIQEKFKNTIYVTYWYESTFIPVEEETELCFNLPGYEDSEYAVLLPKKPEETSTAVVEPTVPEPTKPEETTPPESSPEETTGEETTGEETTAETTAEETTLPEATTGSSKRKSSGSGSSSVSSVSATTAAETTAAEATEEPTTAETIEQENITATQEPTQEASPESKPEKNEAADRDGGSGNMAEKTVKDAVQQITGQQIEQQQENFLKLDVIETAGGHSQMQPGELIVYRMAIRNEGTEIMKDIRVRDYLPDYTSFVSVEDGSYGVINGRQHVTWMLDQLNPGEEKELVLSVKVFQCVPENHRIENQVYWQADNKAQTNDPENPSAVKSIPAIIIG